jgi:CRISPR-associated protein Csx10
LQPISLSGAASRGLGKVTIQASIDALQLHTNEVKQRIEHFNQKIMERWQLWSAFGADTPLVKPTFFTVNLQSDAILSEQWQRTMVISEEMLRQFAGISKVDDPTLRLQTAYSSYDYRSGWTLRGVCRRILSWLPK